MSEEANNIPENDSKLSDKDELFINEYLNSLNATQAYQRVYTDAAYTTCRTEGAKKLADPNIKERIKEQINIRNENLNISSEFVVRGLIDVANQSLQRTPVMEFDSKTFSMVQKKDDYGMPLFQPLDSHAANKALELLGKHTGAFEKDNKQKKNDVGDVAELQMILEAARNGIKG